MIVARLGAGFKTVAPGMMGGGDTPEGRTMSDFLQPWKRKIVNASPDPSGQAQRNTLCDAVGELDVLADGVKEGVSGTGS